LKSDFSAARLHLQRAQDYLRGSDETSDQARQAIDMLLDAVTHAEFRKPASNVIAFPEQKHSCQS